MTGSRAIHYFVGQRLLGLCCMYAMALLTVVTVAGLRHLTPLGDWLGAPGASKPITAMLALLMGSVPGVLVVRRLAVRFRPQPVRA